MNYKKIIIAMMVACAAFSATAKGSGASGFGGGKASSFKAPSQVTTPTIKPSNSGSSGFGKSTPSNQDTSNNSQAVSKTEPPPKQTNSNYGDAMTRKANNDKAVAIMNSKNSPAPVNSTTNTAVPSPAPMAPVQPVAPVAPVQQAATPVIIQQSGGNTLTNALLMMQLMKPNPQPQVVVANGGQGNQGTSGGVSSTSDSGPYTGNTGASSSNTVKTETSKGKEDDGMGFFSTIFTLAAIGGVGFLLNRKYHWYDKLKDKFFGDKGEEKIYKL